MFTLFQYTTRGNMLNGSNILKWLNHSEKTGRGTVIQLSVHFINDTGQYGFEPPSSAAGKAKV